MIEIIGFGIVILITAVVFIPLMRMWYDNK